VDAKRFFPGNAIISGVELFQSGGDGVSVGSRLFVGIFRPVIRDSCQFMLMDKRKISIEVGYDGLLQREFGDPMTAERGDHFGFFWDYYGVLQYNNVAVGGMDGGGDNAYCWGSSLASNPGDAVALTADILRDYPIKPILCSWPPPPKIPVKTYGLEAPDEVSPYDNYKVKVKAPQKKKCNPLEVFVKGTDGYEQSNDFYTPQDGFEFEVKVPGTYAGVNDTITMICWDRRSGEGDMAHGSSSASCTIIVEFR
jgi:hypothetical protein